MAAAFWPLIELFPQAVFLSGLDQLSRVLTTCETVLSERFHGAIVGLLLNKRVYASVRGDNNTSKIEDLFNDLGISAFCSESSPQDYDDPFPYESVAAGIAGLRLQYSAACGRLLDELENASHRP